MFKDNKKYWLILIVILAIAGFFRLWQIDSIPPGLYPDEAINANDALESLKTGNFKVFYPENNGREGLFMWLLGLSFSIFGISIWSFKIVPAFIGILTVLGLYLLTKELFFNHNKNTSHYAIALLSSFFLSISFWHINFSRIGFRVILLPFILVFGFYFLFKGFRQRKIMDFIISGVFFGLGFYTYNISYRVIAILFLLLIFWWFLYNFKVKREISFFVKSIFYFLFFAFLIFLPLGIYFLNHFQDLISRPAPVSIFATDNPIKEFTKSLILHLGMFNFYGDANWRHNYAGFPILFWPLGILFLVGFFIVAIKGFYYSQKSDDLSLIISRNCGFLIMWFALGLLPGILTSEGVPHALRIIGVIPPVFIFCGLAGWHLFNFLKKNVENKKLLILTSIVFLLMLTVVQFDKYFIKWAKKPEVKDAFSRNYVEIGNYLNSLSPEIQKYVIVDVPGVPVPWPDGVPIPAQTIMFIENTKFGKPKSVYLKKEELNKIKIEKETVVLPMGGYNQELFKDLFKKFPNGRILKKDKIWIIKLNN